MTDIHCQYIDLVISVKVTSSDLPDTFHLLLLAGEPLTGLPEGSHQTRKDKRLIEISIPRGERKSSLVTFSIHHKNDQK